MQKDLPGVLGALLTLEQTLVKTRSLSLGTSQSQPDLLLRWIEGKLASELILSTLRQELRQTIKSGLYKVAISFGPHILEVFCLTSWLLCNHFTGACCLSIQGEDIELSQVLGGLNNEPVPVCIFNLKSLISVFVIHVPKTVVMNLISVLQSVQNLTTAESYRNIRLSCEKKCETFDFLWTSLFTDGWSCLGQNGGGSVWGFVSLPL